MLTGIMVTDNGPHSPAQWAYGSASMLLEGIKVDPHSPRRIDLEIAKDKIRPLLSEVFLVHHQKVQVLERQALSEGDHERLMAKLDASEHTDIDQALLYTMGDVSNDPVEIDKHVERMIRERIETDLKTSMHIERSWHADKHEDNIHAIAFKANYHGGRKEII